MPERAIGTLCRVENRVEKCPIVVRPFKRVIRVRDPVRQKFPGSEILNLDGVGFIAFQIGGISQ